MKSRACRASGPLGGPLRSAGKTSGRFSKAGLCYGCAGGYRYHLLGSVISKSRKGWKLGARLTPVSWLELVRCLQKLGFDGPYKGGKH